MISFEVGALFTIEDNASGTLQRLSEQFTELDELVTSLKDNLASVGAEDSFGGLQAGIQTLSDALAALDEKSGAFGETMATSASEATAAFGRAAEEVDAITAAYIRATDAAIAFGEAAAGGGAAGAVRGGGFGGFRGNEGPGGGPGGMGGSFGGGGGGGGGGGRGGFGGFTGNTGPGGGPGGFGGFTGNAGPGGGPGGMGGSFGGAGNAAAGAGGAAAARRGGGGGGGGGHGGGLLGAFLPMIELGADFVAFKDAMHEDMALKQTLGSINIDQDTPEGRIAEGRLRSMIADTSRGTIYSRAKAASALPDAGPELGFSGTEAIDKLEKVYPIALRLGELSEMRHKGSLGEEAVAGIQFAHLTDTYEPEALTKKLDMINAIALRNDSSVSRQQSIMKYGIPVAIAAGIDPDRAAMEMGGAEQFLGKTSTVGTGYSAMLLSVLKSGGGINAHLSKGQQDSLKKQEHELETALKLEDPAILKSHKEHGAGSLHDQAMKFFGMTDASVAEAHKAGNLDLMIEKKVREASQKHPDEAFAQLVNLMGVRGARYAEHFMAKDAVEREERFNTGVKGAFTVEEMQKKLSETPEQQLEQVWANLSNIGNTLATATFPGLTTALETVNAALLRFGDFLDHHETAAKVGGYGLLGLGAAALTGGAASVLRIATAPVRLIGGLLGGGASALSGGAGGVGGLFGGAGVLGPLGIPIALSAAGYAAGTYLKDTQPESTTGANKALADLKYRQEHGGMPSWSAPGGTPRLAGPRANAVPPAPTVHAPVTVNLGPVTMNGVADEKTFGQILSRLTDAVKQALSHSNGGGMGSELSPYTFGGS